MSELTLIPDGNKHRNYYIVDQLKVFTFCKNGIPQYQQVLQGKFPSKQKTKPTSAKNQVFLHHCDEGRICNL